MLPRKNKLLINLAILPAIALAGCATVEEAVGEAVAETHRATLSSTEMVPAGGDRDGFARAEVSVGDEINQVCYDINDVRNLAAITGVTIHRGARGATGPMVLRLREANEGGWKNCVGKDEWVEDRLEWSPDNYYVQIATSEYPGGAIRGQLR
jgi:hypothetical protein